MCLDSAARARFVFAMHASNICSMLRMHCATECTGWPTWVQIYARDHAACTHLCSLCTVSGSVPEEPVVSTKSGHIFEKRLVLKAIEVGCCCLMIVLHCCVLLKSFPPCVSHNTTVYLTHLSVALCQFSTMQTFTPQWSFTPHSLTTHTTLRHQTLPHTTLPTHRSLANAQQQVKP